MTTRYYTWSKDSIATPLTGSNIFEIPESVVNLCFAMKLLGRRDDSPEAQEYAERVWGPNNYKAVWVGPPYDRSTSSLDAYFEDVKAIKAIVNEWEKENGPIYRGCPREV